MNKPTIETLARRLDRVERENRWLKRAGLVALAVIAAVVLVGQAMPKSRIVEAAKFVLTDANGKVRAVLGQESGGTTAPSVAEVLRPAKIELGKYGLHLYGADGGMRASLTGSWLLGGGGYLYLQDKETASSAELMVGSNGAMLSLSATKQSLEEARQLGRAIAAGKMEEAKKLMFKANTAHLLTESVGSSLQFSDKGTTRATLGHTSLKTVRTGVVQTRPSSSLVLFGEDGKVIWSAP